MSRKVPCDTCGAAIGENCRSMKSGKDARSEHFGRMEAAAKAYPIEGKTEWWDKV
jgi:hypothetical protein